ncbi:hypothetical protein L1987_47820 [Smallanthus sonchifolius]|uniref:Uncharacterized protein n=1 Tax=Smallanthus sonchifolius TaxID=185202 RepID=A0ACB9FQ94_9ASTR|nr:hypothetical protein L1987_47820 [Smallanthus sonchifolius]
MLKVIEYGGRVKDFGSFFPILERFDLHGTRKGAMKQFKKIFAYWEDIIEERRAHVNSSTWSSDQAQSFLDRLLENGFSNNQIYQLTMVMNYTVPKNAKIFVNLWAMGRDPKLWDNPLSFNPERFIESKLDFKGQDFELLPFGSGRRMCLGMSSGIKSVESMLACLIHEFDWELPNGDDPSKLDMNERFGIALKREMPLMLIFKQRNN